MSDTEEREGPRQTIRRMPGEESGQPEVGPFFPSGMNTVEAAMAGADADLSDDQKETIGKLQAINDAGGTVDGTTTDADEE